MATRKKPLVKQGETKAEESKKIRCLCCGREKTLDNFYDSISDIYRADGKLHHCRDCIADLYQSYVKKYWNDGYTNPEHKAIERICMLTDVYYSEKVIDTAINATKTKDIEDPLLMGVYFRMIRLNPYRTKDYDETIRDRFQKEKDKEVAFSKQSDKNSESYKKLKRSEAIFGSGFEKADYEYLQEQYDDWTARHECKTKAQEEVFKQICFTQLELLKTTRAGKDTKDLTATFQKLLDTAKLTPKQNAGDTMADAQTMGTLINKWENTDPIPEPEPEFRDVDGIGKYLSMFFKWPLAKMLGFNNVVPQEYEDYMEEYTAHKPLYDGEDEADEVAYNHLFGSSVNEDEGAV